MSRFVATHKLLLGGITHRVKREADHWLTQDGQELYAGFAEELKPKKQQVEKGRVNSVATGKMEGVRSSTIDAALAPADKTEKKEGVT